jgi:hypothetical protein
MASATLPQRQLSIQVALPLPSPAAGWKNLSTGPCWAGDICSLSWVPESGTQFTGMNSRRLTPEWTKPTQTAEIPGSASYLAGQGGRSPGRLMGFLVGVSFLLLGMAGE